MPSRQIAAPASPRRRWPIRTDWASRCTPGHIWLSAIVDRNSRSVSQPRRRTISCCMSTSVVEPPPKESSPTLPKVRNSAPRRGGPSAQVDTSIVDPSEVIEPRAPRRQDWRGDASRGGARRPRYYRRAHGALSTRRSGAGGDRRSGRRVLAGVAVEALELVGEELAQDARVMLAVVGEVAVHAVWRSGDQPLPRGPHYCHQAGPLHSFAQQAQGALHRRVAEGEEEGRLSARGVHVLVRG